MSQAPGAVDIPAMLNGLKITRFQIAVALLCAAVVFMDGFDAQAIGYVAPSLSRAWQLKPGALGPVFAAGLVGLAIGALVGGPLADRFGRKPVIIASTIWFGLCTLLTVSADSLTTLFAWRLATGLGLGGAMPNAIALTSEYSPDRSRARMVMAMFIGFSLGSALGGAFAAQLVPNYGWTIVFWLGGLLPLLLVPLLIAYLPESVRLLALRGDAHNERFVQIVRRINPALSIGPGTRFTSVGQHARGFTVVHLFKERRGTGTVLLWIMFFMNLLDLYFLANWLPTVVHATGISEKLAVVTTAMLQIGGVIGTLTLAPLIDRFRPFAVLGIAYFMAAVVLTAIAAGSKSINFIMPAVFVTGFCVVGAQIGANALAALYYPTAIRATGVGWALGIGRIGSIIGPLVGGMLLAQERDSASLFLFAAAPALVSACAVLLMGRLKPELPVHQRTTVPAVEPAQ